MKKKGLEVLIEYNDAGCNFEDRNSLRDCVCEMGKFVSADSMNFVFNQPLPADRNNAFSLEEYFLENYPTDNPWVFDVVERAKSNEIVLNNLRALFFMFPTFCEHIKQSGHEIFCDSVFDDILENALDGLDFAHQSDSDPLLLATKKHLREKDGNR